MTSKEVVLQIEQLKNKLKEKDYIGRKIAEVLLVGTEAEKCEITIEYSKDIVEAKKLREQINELEAQLTVLYEEEEKQRKQKSEESAKRRKEQTERIKMRIEKIRKEQEEIIKKQEEKIMSKDTPNVPTTD